MKTKKVTLGEIRLYEQIKDSEVRALVGISDVGNGWRPVCKGMYLGRACYSTEKEAIKQGEKIVAELKRQVEAAIPAVKKVEPCGACGDGCVGRDECRVKEENPPLKAPVKKRVRNRKTKPVAAAVVE